MPDFEFVFYCGEKAPNRNLLCRKTVGALLKFSRHMTRPHSQLCFLRCHAVVNAMFIHCVLMGKITFPLWLVCSYLRSFNVYTN